MRGFDRNNINLRLKNSYNTITLDYTDDNAEAVNFIIKYIHNISHCNNLILINKSNDIPLLFIKPSKITFVNKPNTKGINFSNIKHIEFNRCETISNLMTKEIKITLDTLTLYKSKLSKGGSLLPSTKKLILRFSGIQPEQLLLMDLKNLEELSVTGEFLYNMPDIVKKELIDNNIEITLDEKGSFNMIKESMSSRLLTTLYSSFKDKNILKKFFELLSSNNINIKNITDDSIQYTSTINLRNLLSTTSDKKSSYIIVAVDNNSGIKYIVDYSMEKQFGTRWSPKLKFLNNNLDPVVLYKNDNIESTSISRDIYKSNISLPSIKKLIDETDFVFIINKDTVRNYSSGHLVNKRIEDKKGSTVLMSDQDHKKDLDVRKNKYIENKYVFNINGDRQTITYINTLLPRFTDYYNLYPKNKCYLLLGKIHKHIQTDYNTLIPKKNTIKKLSNEDLSEMRLKYKKKVESSITNDVSNLLITNSKFNISNNYYIQKNSNTKIFPDVNSLSELVKVITEWENILKNYFKKNPIKIEYINDMDVLMDRYKNIYDYASKNMPDISILYGMNLNEYLFKRNVRDWYKILLPHSIIKKSDAEIKNIINSLITKQIEEIKTVNRRLKIYLNII